MKLTGNKDCLLDTCVVINIFKEELHLKNLDKFETVYISNIVIGELYYGAYTSANPIKHINQIQEFINLCSVISCDENTPLFYGTTKAHLKKIGKLIPENDIWIAALSIQHDLPLYTIDKHFNYITDLTTIS